MPITGFYAKVDTQIHTLNRDFEDLRMLGYCGVKDLISTLYMPVKIKNAGTFEDLFNLLLNKEPERGNLANINIYPALGIHPSMVPSDNKVLNEALNYLEDALRTKKAIAVGETGLDKGTQEEMVSFKRHLELGRSYRLPVIIHTPKENKPEITKLIMREIKKSKIDKAVIDHCDMSNVKFVLNDVRNDIKIGLSISKKNLSVRDALEVYKNYSYPNRFVLNSNAGSGPGDYLSFVKAVDLFLEKGVSDSILKKLCYDNALDIFRGLATSGSF